MFSWLVNHILGNLPAWTWPAAAGGAAVIYFFAGIIAHIPNLKAYSMFIKPVAFIALLISVFMYGGQGVIAVYQDQLKDAQHKVDVAEQAGRDANEKLALALADKTHLVKGRAYGVKKIIEVQKVEIDRDCAQIDSKALQLYNQGVRNKPEDLK
jgi:hypothetical protein